MERLQKFLDFCFDHKLARTVKRMSDDKIADLYQRYSIWAFNFNATSRQRIQGIMVIYTIETELKRRYPDNPTLQRLDFTEPINLAPILKNQRRDKHGKQHRK